jgi:hypothetical protein
VRYFNTLIFRRTVIFINNKTFFVLVVQTDKDLEEKINQLWSAIYNLQHDVDKLLFPNRKILYTPKMKTEEALRSGLRKGIEESKKADSFLTPTKRVTMQSSLDTWINKPEEWSDVQWEDWAKKLYNGYPEARQYLPSWFIKIIEKH